jgi:ribosome-associated heat shock protein Hsp15
LAGPSGPKNPEIGPKLRLDKWLWAARFFKTRGLAADMIEAGRLRLNGQRTQKPGHAVAVGAVLTFPQGNQIRVVRVTALHEKRGPAAQAQLLYEDLDPAPKSPTALD